MQLTFEENNGAVKQQPNAPPILDEDGEAIITDNLAVGPNLKIPFGTCTPCVFSWNLRHHYMVGLYKDLKS